ncbi:interleukin-7 receptor subunit alpha isoform X1 [Ictalurus furcatus]|uniref:interleukin-7 receptor subunit alpha isoform X1 n=1 Tax=Ictalurus furcatus TaxID=66913 RepID=UPI00235063DE|nr:interleukin-7 receptor subunit alpha isoform X1 [Ictalurus furcatus]
MATLFWMLLILYPFVAHSQSGDDEAPIDTDCWSLMTLQQSSLVCVLNEFDPNMCEKVTLCHFEGPVSICSNATVESNRFSFWSLSPVTQYELYIHIKDEKLQTQKLNLVKMVKITTPEIENATYKDDEAVIHIKYMHDYVKTPDFQVEFWGDRSRVKEKVIVKSQQIRIGGDKLKDSEIYNVRVRAKPVDNFDGRWTKWSRVKNFSVNHITAKEAPIDTDCWSLMTLQQSSLVCVLNEFDPNMCEKVTLCHFEGPVSICSNATVESNRFTFWSLSPVTQYELYIHIKDEKLQTQKLNLVKMVKITTPEIENATYKHDEAVIHIKYMHDYVKTPDFQVEFWGDRSKVKEKVIVKYKQMRIGGDKLKDSEIYNVRVRAKPVDYFDGNWTKWSRVKNFSVNHITAKAVEAPPVLYILLCITPIVLVAIGFLILQWKKEIQTCLFPDVPDPKATLAQIHRQKEHLPVSFSPEMFKDINIYPVVYTDEKQFTPEFGDDQGDTTESCDDGVAALIGSCPTSMCEKQNEDGQSLESETSQIETKLLDESASDEDVRDNPGCQSVVALQRHSKDETYVTMSSLFKTQ